MKDEKKLSLREEWQLICRAIGIWQKIVPGFWFWQGICILTETISPYFGLYMSAQMVNELAGDCNVRRLLTLAAITVTGGFGISLVKRFLQGRRNLSDQLDWLKYSAFMLDSQNDFQYEHLENPDVILQRAEIEASWNASGNGLSKVKWALSSILQSFLHIVFSISLTVSMFSMIAQGEFTGFMGFINSGFSVITVILLILLNVFCSIKIGINCAVKTHEAVIDTLAKENVRLFTYDHLWGSDMIIFDLNKIAMDEIRNFLLYPKWVVKSEKIRIHYNSLSIILDAILNIVIFIFIAAKAFIGVFGIGNFILYQGTVKRLIEGVSGLATEIGTLRHNSRYLVQLYDFLDLPNAMYKGTLAVEKRDDIDYEIEFRDVSFQYPRTDTWALRHVNMKFKIGDKLAIVGENGSGKTTFIKLLCRLYDPTEGKILLNGIDITRYRYDEYMALFSVVFQDYTLFGFPLGEIVAANHIYAEEKVRDCLKRAGLGEKLSSLDNDSDEQEKDALKRAVGRDYDSEGIDFSGGEKQKIALARALYKDAPFVILDEPTAALDPIAEAEVYENFNRIVQNKTAVFISHRLSSCRFCDTIAVFDHGQLVQTGTHDELVAEVSSKYSQLWHAQAQYYVK